MSERFDVASITRGQIWDNCDDPSSRELLEMAQRLISIGFFRAAGAIGRQVLEISLWDWYKALVMLTGQPISAELAPAAIKGSRLRSIITALKDLKAISNEFKSRLDLAVDAGNKSCHALPITPNFVSASIEVAGEVFEKAAAAERRIKDWLVERESIAATGFGPSFLRVDVDYCPYTSVAFA